MRTLAVIVTWNGMPWIARCLGSLSASEPKPDVVVVDNASTDGTPEWIEENCPEVLLLRNKVNEGFAKANNRALRIALEKGYDFVYLMNQDAWVETGTIAGLEAVSTEFPEYGVLSPMQVKADYSECDNLFVANVLNRVSGSLEAAVAEVPSVMAAHWLIPKSALLTVGLFAPVFPFYGEDDNWCDRARYHGLKVGVVPSEKAVHDRADRKEPLKKIIHRNYYMSSLRQLCDINRPLWNRCLYVLLFTLVKAWKYKSLSVFTRFWELWRLRREIVLTRAETSHVGAFVKTL